MKGTANTHTVYLTSTFGVEDSVPEKKTKSKQALKVV